jgi:hypothetical protein
MLLLNANRIEIVRGDSSIFIFHEIVPQQTPYIGERSGFIYYHAMIFGEPYYLKEKLFLETDVLQKGIKVRFAFEYIETYKVPRYDNLNPRLHRLLFPRRTKYIRISVVKTVQATQCVQYMPENKVIKFCQE